MNVDLRITAKIEGAVSVAGDLGNPRQDLAVKAILDLTSGTAAGKADVVFSDTRTLAASATESLDLAGVLIDVFGATASFAKVVALYVKAASANVNDVVLGGAASNGFVAPFGSATDTIKVKSGGALLLMADGGYAVTAGTADLLKVTNGSSGTPVTYDIVIIGRSA